MTELAAAYITISTFDQFEYGNQPPRAVVAIHALQEIGKMPNKSNIASILNVKPITAVVIIRSARDAGLVIKMGKYYAITQKGLVALDKIKTVYYDTLNQLK